MPSALSTERQRHWRPPSWHPVEARHPRPWVEIPTTCASRFLHFYNPKLFPNVDNALTNQQVLQVFGPEFDKYCADTGIAEWDYETSFYGQYMLWAGKHIQMADPEFFADFETWFKAQVEGEEDPNGVLEEITKYHAAAFEFVAVGAAKLWLEG